MGDKDPFAAADAYQQNTLSRREVIEASHEAAKIMAEMIGQEGQYHAPGAAGGGHSALPLPKTDEKFFLHNKKTTKDDKDDKETREQEAEAKRVEDDLWNQDGEEYGGYWSAQWSDVQGEEEEEEEEEELITDILERKLAYLYMAFQPPEPVEGPADTLFIVSKFKDSKANERALIRAHSQVLKRYNDAFDELIGYRPPVVPTPSNEEDAEESGMSISWKQPAAVALPVKSRGYSLMAETFGNLQEQRQRDWEQALKNYDDLQKQTLHEEEQKKLEEEQGTVVESSAEPTFGARGSVRFKEDEFLQLKRPSQDNITYAARSEKRLSQTFTDDGLMDLGLESVIGNLKDSHKPLQVKEFLDASENLLNLPGWEHLPADVKESFEKFASSVNKFKNPATTEGIKAAELEANTLGGGGGLESNFLGMVGRRQSKQMADILNSITQGVPERKKTAVMLAQAKKDELVGTGKNVTATAPRTALERRKSEAYVANQEKRNSIAALEPRKSMALIATQGRRIGPSFLERRQSKALMEIARRESAKFEADDLDMKRRTSKAAVAAFERRKRMSVLEKKSSAELEFSGDFDGGWNGAQKVLPPAKEGQRISSASLGLASGTAELVTEGIGAQARRVITGATERRRSSNLAGRKKSVGFLERKASKTLMNMKEKEREDIFLANYSPPPARRPSIPPPLTHTRDQDKEAVAQFYQFEDDDIYATSSLSNAEPEPKPLPRGVEFVIEKRHWTADVLHAILEFIYTEVVHIHCEELPEVYAAANEILLSSLTDAIRLKPIIQYFRLAVVNEYNRVALLNLAKQLTSEVDYKNYVNRNKDFLDLKRLCEKYTLDGANERKPYTLLFETAHIAFRNLPFVTPGLHDINGEMVLILKNPREGTRLYEQNQEQDEYLTFRKKLSDRHREKPLLELHWLGKWPPLEKTRNRDKAWKIIFFDFPNLNRDIPLKNYGFYKHVCAITCRPWAPEVISIRLVVGFLICPVLFDALMKTFPELDIKAGRGAGYYMGGETHGNCITLTGAPRYLLQACKGCPRHMIGRTVLRVSSPSERTWIRLWTSTNRFGVDLETNALYFLKPLIQIQKMLEFWHDLDQEACYDVLTPREMVELVEPHDPF